MCVGGACARGSKWDGFAEGKRLDMTRQFLKDATKCHTRTHTHAHTNTHTSIHTPHQLPCSHSNQALGVDNVEALKVRARARVHVVHALADVGVEGRETLGSTRRCTRNGGEGSGRSGLQAQSRGKGV